MSQGDAVRAVDAAPGHTVHWYREQGYLSKFRWSWLYRDFQQAWRNGLIERRDGTRRGTLVYYPVCHAGEVRLDD